MKRLTLIKQFLNTFTSESRRERKINKLENKINELEIDITKSIQERDILYEEIRKFNIAEQSNEPTMGNCAKVFDLRLRRTSVDSTIQTLTDKRDNLIMGLEDSVS